LQPVASCFPEARSFNTSAAFHSLVAVLNSFRYQFSEDVLRLPAIKTSLIFSVGKQPVEQFRMIERHYFRNQLVKSFDFKFGFCIPGSTNTWDAVYSVPPLDDALIAEMIANPYETTSDSFYFAGNKLIMHNKALYSYVVEDRAQVRTPSQHLFGVLLRTRPPPNPIRGLTPF